MTPQEIFDYKTSWLKDCHNISTVHDDLEFDAKRWCKENLQQHQWSFTKFTDIYEHSIHFEKEEFKTKFEKEFGK